jgi:hypothetical protein
MQVDADQADPVADVGRAHQAEAIAGRAEEDGGGAADGGLVAAAVDRRAAAEIARLLDF